MRKHLFLTLMATAGLIAGGVMPAYADPAEQSRSTAATSITGTVLDENNDPVIGASVTIKGTTRGVITNTDGHFTLSVAPGTTLVVSYVGYKSEEVKAAGNMRVYLQPTSEQLNQVVVVGYGTQKKANLTGAVGTVDVERVLDGRSQSDVVKALQGAVPGLTITSGDGGVNTAASIKIRGTGTLSNGQVSNPLIVVDGVPVDDLSLVNPDDIQDISVLKDAASSAIYGTRAAFGVILITTKTPSQQDRVTLKYSNNFGWSKATVLPEFDNVPAQLRAGIQVTDRDGGEAGFFGMWFADILPYADAWYQQNGGKKADHRLMRPYQSMSDVGDYYYNPELGYNMYYADWDVAGILFNSAAPSQKHNVSLEGVSGKTQYRVAFGYNQNQDLMEYNPDKSRRYTASVNLQTQIFPWMKAGVRFNYAQKQYKTHYFGGAGEYYQMWRWGSFWTVLGYRQDEEGVDHEYRTIAYRQQAGERNYITNDTRMQAWMEINPIDDLTIHADYTYDITAQNNDMAWLPVYGYNTWTNITSKNPLVYMSTQSGTEAGQYNTRQSLWNMNVYATYDKSFGNNNLKVMVGGTAEQYDYNYFYVTRDVLLDNSLPYLALTTGGNDGTQVYLGNTITSRATAGFFGRVNYDYKGIYLFEANGRYDGSSRFPADDQWAFFPSVSAGYRFSEEGYFKPIKETNILTNGKIRASYGHIGNEAIGNYMFIPTVGMLGSSSVSWLNTSGTKVQMGTTPSLVSKDLTWERVITTDVGLDLGFLNNSLNVTFDWFQRDTKDMLAPGMQLPSLLGASAPYVNEGQLRTRGWEFGVNWNHSFGDADIYAAFNIYDGKTKIVKYNNESGILSGFNSDTYYGDIWGFEYDRYFEESDFSGKDEKGNWIYKPGIADQTGLQTDNFVYGPGDIKFKDLDGDGKITGGIDGKTDADGKPIGKGTLGNHGDLKVIGNALPRYEYSLRLGGAWKGFDIDMYFQGVGKRDMWKCSGFIIPYANNDDVIYANQMSYNQAIKQADDSFQYIVDQSNDYPCLYGSNAAAGTVGGISMGRHNFYPQDRYLMNMAYLRFKTLTIGYTLPIELTKKALIQKARVYFSADNLCLLYNGMKNYPLDPEIGSQWTTDTQTDSHGNSNDSSYGYFGRRAPLTRTLSLGLQVTF